MKVIKTLNKQLAEIQSTKSELSKDISRLRLEIQELSKEKAGLIAESRIQDKSKIIKLSRDIKIKEQDLLDLQEMLEANNSKVIDIPKDRVIKEYQEYLMTSPIVEEYKKLIEITKIYEDQLKKVLDLSHQLQEESRQTKYLLAENVESFKSMADMYRVVRCDIHKLDNGNLITYLQDNVGELNSESDFECMKTYIFNNLFHL